MAIVSYHSSRHFFLSFESTEFSDRLPTPEAFFNFFLSAIMGLLLPGVPSISNTESSLCGSTSSLGLFKFFSGEYDGDVVSHSLGIYLSMFSFKGVSTFVSKHSTLKISFRNSKFFVSLSFTAVNAEIMETD